MLAQEADGKAGHVGVALRGLGVGEVANEVGDGVADFVVPGFDAGEVADAPATVAVLATEQEFAGLAELLGADAVGEVEGELEGENAVVVVGGFGLFEPGFEAGKALGVAWVGAGGVVGGGALRLFR